MRQQLDNTLTKTTLLYSKNSKLVQNNDLTKKLTAVMLINSFTFN